MMASNSKEAEGSHREDMELLKQEKNEEMEGEDSKYGVLMAAVFAVGVVAGTGVLVLPNALAKTGWSGLIVLFSMAAVQTYTGILLGRCWIILQERFPIYSQQTRDPYAAIGYEAFGTTGRIIATSIVNLSIFGVLVSFILIIGENVTILMNIQGYDHCYMLLIVGAVLCPMLWLGTPKDFWPMAILAAASTGLASLLLLVAILRQRPERESASGGSTAFIAPSPINYFSAIGVMIVAFNGHQTYPVLQHDMKEPTKFPRSLLLGACVVSTYFLPLMVAGYAVFGEDLADEPNIFQVVGQCVEGFISLVLITLHIVLAFVIYGNPLFQEAEEIVGIEKHFSLQRVAVRSSLLLFIVFIAASLPFFATILSLLGGTTMLASSLVYPVCCYWRLRHTESEDERWQTKRLPPLLRVLLVGILLLSAVICIVTTYSNVVTFRANFNLTTPCYLS